MKIRIARKILKRTGHHITVVGGHRVDLTRPNTYKHGTVNQAITTIYPTIDLTPGTLAHPKKWGLLDQDTDTWFGNSQGPMTYNNKQTAKAMRQIVAARIPCSPLRISVEPFTSATVKLDEITYQNTFDQAMDLIEKRGY